MNTRNSLRALLVAAGLALPFAAHADTGFSFDLHVGGAPQYAHAPQRGYVQAPGHWAWDGYRYVWMQGGAWAAAQPAHHGWAPYYQGGVPYWRAVSPALHWTFEERRRNYREQRD